MRQGKPHAGQQRYSGAILDPDAMIPLLGPFLTVHIHSSELQKQVPQAGIGTAADNL